jgi:hypothetical protein
MTDQITIVKKSGGECSDCCLDCLGVDGVRSCRGANLARNLGILIGNCGNWHFEVEKKWVQSTPENTSVGSTVRVKESCFDREVVGAYGNSVFVTTRPMYPQDAVVKRYSELEVLI